MSEQTITRYYGSTGKPMCLLSDHEAALAAKDARISELERLLEAEIQACVSEENKSHSLRVAIRRKAQEFRQRGGDAAAAELLALLEKKL